MNDSQPRKDIADGLYEEAYSLMKQERYDEAADAYRKVSAEYGDLFHDWNLSSLIGACYYHSGDYGQAAEYLTKAYQTTPKESEGESYINTVVFLVETLFCLGKHREAIEIAEDGELYFHQLKPAESCRIRFDFRLHKGRALLYLGRFAEALEQFMQLKDLVPKDGDPTLYGVLIDFEVGRALFHDGDRNRAWDLLSAMDISHLGHSLHHYYHFVMMALAFERKQWERAHTHFHELENEGIPEIWRPEAYHYAGVAYYFLGDGRAARDYLEQSMKYPSNLEWIRKHTSVFLEELSKAGH